MAQKLASVAEVDEILGGVNRDFGTEYLGLESAIGRILREPLRADRDGPPSDRATMDGYALRWADWAAGERQFHVVGQQWPGSPALDLPATRGACLEIMTGAPCPVGADCVIPFEETSVSNAIVSIAEGVKINQGQCLHRAGSDFRAGDVLVPAGIRLGAAEIGIAASCGWESLPVGTMPRVTLVSTGDELVPVHETPEPYQIRSSNIPAIHAVLFSLGCHRIEMRHLRDDRESVEKELRQLPPYPLIIITGGVSKGRKDWIAPALSEMADTLFHGVTQRPGKPMGVWCTPESVIFALPGNPVSALTGLHRYILPWLLRNAGLTALQPGRKLTLAKDIAAPAGLTWFLPVSIDAEGLAHPAPTNTSGDFAGLAKTAGFLETPADAKLLKRGESYPFTPWHR